MKREDDFEERRKHLIGLSEVELEQRFWELAEKVVDPLIELAEKNTSPSNERSVLLRMGFSGLEAQSIVEGAIDRGLLGKGAGHIVYRLAKDKNMEIREAGLGLVKGNMWEDVKSIFQGGEQ
ncbi:MAG TPA: ornithine aminomutase subunit alpha [Tissierellaceae bacterium]|nr:ornithine aminomutase subunit alpha [Tissierellaceae bacterium]